MNRMKDEAMLTEIALDASGASERAQQTEADLALLADQLLAIARELRSTDDRVGSDVALHAPDSISAIHISSDAAAPTPQNDNREGKLARARAAYANRRSRTAIFGKEELFGEPAWDILLDLYIAHAEGKSVSVSSACIGSASPPTTGLRWLGVLAEHKLILREHDPEDQRRVLVRLTESGVAAMEEYFSRASHSG